MGDQRQQELGQRCAARHEARHKDLYRCLDFLVVRAALALQCPRPVPVQGTEHGSRVTDLIVPQGFCESAGIGQRLRFQYRRQVALRLESADTRGNGRSGVLPHASPSAHSAEER